MTTGLLTRARTLAFTAILATAAGAAAEAQTLTSAWGTNGYVSFNGLYDVSTQENTVTTEQTINAESATITATTETGKRPVYDVTAGGRITGNFGMGFGATYGTAREEARVQGRIPHPFYFNQPRTLAGTSDLDRTDLMVHISGMWLLPFSAKVQGTVFGGPTWFQLKQQVITSATMSDSYPFDTVSLAAVERERKTVSRWGYHAGFDLSYFFAQHVGLQGLVRYSAATVSLSNTGVASDVKVGGLHAGVGLRVRY